MAIRAFLLQTPTYQPARIPLSLKEPYGYTQLIPRYRHLYENSYLLVDQNEILLITHQSSTEQRCTVRLIDEENTKIIDECLRCEYNSYFLNLNLADRNLQEQQKLRFDIIIHDENAVIKAEEINVRLQSSLEMFSTPYENFISVSMRQLVDQPILYEERPFAGKFPDLEAFGMAQEEIITRAYRRLDRPAIAVLEPRTSFEEPIRKQKVEFAARSSQKVVRAAANQLCEVDLQNVKLLNWRGENADAGLKYVDFVDNQLILFCTSPGLYSLKWVETVLADGQKSSLASVTIKVE